MMKNDENIIIQRDYYITLYDYYGDLLTPKQKQYFSDFYDNDLTLSEIALNNNISRSAVFDAIDKINKLLKGYEDVLRLYDKSKKKEKLYEEYENKSGSYKELINKLKEIE